MILQKLAILGLLADFTQAKNSWSNAKFRKKFEKRLAKNQGFKLNRKNSTKNSSKIAARQFGGESVFISAVTAVTYCGELENNQDGFQIDSG